MYTFIFTFYTHFGAQAFHRQLKKLSLDSKLMPVPRTLSSSCGTCVSCTAGALPDYSRTEDLEAVYRVNGVGYDVIYKEES